MSTPHLSRTVVATAALATVGALALGGSAAPAGPAASAAAPKRITSTGVGKVRLGKTHGQLRAAGAVGPIRPGCELGGPDTRSARLKAPLKGSVNYSLNAPRKVRDIQVTGGARARGVRIGATIPEIKDAFPKAKVNRDTEETFGITLVRIPRDGGGRLAFAVDVDTDEVVVIGIPRLAFCE